MPAAIYARQSIEKADSVSIEAQIERCKAVCVQSGWQYEIYSDVGFSGKNINRPNFERLLCGIRAGKIDALVSYKLDRISRSITDFAQLLQLFEEHGVHYISATEQFDTTSPVGRAMIYIVMVFAQLERETITQRVSDNYRYRASRGLYMGGNAPLGYTSKKIVLDGRKASVLTPDTPSAEVVKSIFADYLGGFNTHQIANRLSGAGVMTAKQKSYSGNAVLRILRNLTYCGNAPELYGYLKSKGYALLAGPDTFDGTHGMCCTFKTHDRNKPVPVEERLVAVGMHEPLIAARKWIAVQERLDTAQVSRRAKPSSRSWLAGLLKCAACGRSFGLKVTRKGGADYAYYACRGNEGQDTGCRNHLRFRATELEAPLTRLLLLHAKGVLQNAPNKEEAPAAENPQSIALRREILDCKSQIKNLMESLGKGNEVLDRHLTETVTTLDARCRDLQAKLSRLEAPDDKPEKHSDFGTFPDTMDMAGLFVSAAVKDKTRIARALINKITVNPDGTVTVEWLI